MAVTVAAFNATLIALANIYIDNYSTGQDTNVYSNGAMQANIFISVNYNGDTTGIEDQIKQYVQDNVVIYVLETSSPLTWVKSTSSNEFLHNIDSASVGIKHPRTTSDIRAPLYFTVPVNSEGIYKWIAKLGDQETSTNTPVTVNVHEYYVTPSDFTIDDVTTYGCAQLRVLRYHYNSFGDQQKLIRCLTYKGVRFTSPEANAYISMIMSTKGHKAGAFLMEKNSAANVALNNHWYGKEDWEAQGGSFYQAPRSTSKYGWEDPLQIPLSDIQNAWNKGIPMIRISRKKLSMGLNGIERNFLMQGFLLEDNFGNRVEININWDAGGWWGIWVVSKAIVKYP